MRQLSKKLATASALATLLGSTAAEARDPFFRPFHDSFFSHFESARSDVTMYEHEDKIYVEAPLPGVEEDDIELTLNKGVLSIQAKRAVSKEKEEKGVYHSNRSYRYQVMLPDSADQEEPEATFRNGLMQVVFSKKSNGEPRRIPISR